MMRRTVPTLVLILLSGCGESSGGDFERTLDSFRDRANTEALQVCGASAADVSDQSDEGNEAARCYYELAVEIDTCRRKALRAHEADARALLACLDRDRAQLVECCTRGAPCSYDRIDQCRQELWQDELAGPCTADTAAIAAAAEACEQGQSIATTQTDPCDRVAQVAVGWDEQSDFGQTPAQTFGAFEGSCSASYVWTGARSPGIDASPATGEGTLHIEITPDHRGALFLRPADEGSCSAQLAIPARLQVETSDGLLQEQLDVVLRRWRGDIYLAVKLPAERIQGGALRMSSSKPGKLWLKLTVQSLGDSCKGYLGIEFEGERDASGASEGFGGGASGRWGLE
jgi:hypothetical protein